MAWSDVPAVLKKIFGYFGPEQHERRVLRKIIGYWDKIRPDISVTTKRNKSYLLRIDILRKELR